MWYNVNINYSMDYLFGGSIALASRIAANSQSANVSNVIFDKTRKSLNALIGAGFTVSQATSTLQKLAGVVDITSSAGIAQALAILVAAGLTQTQAATTLALLARKKRLVLD